MLIVQKYGGTSMGSTERIKNVATRVSKSLPNNQLVIVVSAMSGVTDEILNYANDLALLPNERDLDMALSSGEQISAALLSIALNAMGYKAIALNGRQARILTDSNHTKARIQSIDTSYIINLLQQNYIVVVTGFQGLSNEGEITTLGRGGSDLSAVALAGALHADLCEIYSDVDGIYTTDPRIESKAKKIDRISYDEMLELARVGANVLHPRSVEAAKLNNMKMRVRSSFKLDDLGTLIIGVDEMELNKPVTGLACDSSQVRIVICDIEDKPGNAAKLFNLLAEYDLSVDMIIQSYARNMKNTNDIAFTISKSDMQKFNSIEDKINHIVNASNIFIDEDIVKVSIVGAGMIDRPGIAAKMFDTLASENINIKMISTSEIKISCLVEKKYSELAAKALCSVFNLDGAKVADVKGDLPL